MGRGTFSLVGPGSNEGRVGAKVVRSDKGNGCFFFKLKVGKEERMIEMVGWIPEVLSVHFIPTSNAVVSCIQLISFVLYPKTLPLRTPPSWTLWC